MLTDDEPMESEWESLGGLVGALKEFGAGNVAATGRTKGVLTNEASAVHLPDGRVVVHFLRESMKDKTLNGSRAWVISKEAILPVVK